MGIFACIPLDSKNFEHRNGVVSLHHKPYKEVNIEWRTIFFKSWINFDLIKMVLRNWCWNGALNCYLWMKSTKNICFTSWFIEVDMILFSKLGHFHLCSFCANKILISICSMQIENVQIHKHWWFDDVLGLFKAKSMQSLKYVAVSNILSIKYMRFGNSTDCSVLYIE